jgi:ATP-dependent RNA helicase DDX24/MAK5
MTKKKLKQKSNNDDGLWTDDAGWTAVDVPDDALLGAEEDGFMGLEVLDPTTLSKDQITTLESFNKPEASLSVKQVQNNEKRAAEKKQKAKEKKQRAKEKKRAMKEFDTAAAADAAAAAALPPPSEQKKQGGDIDVSAWESLNLHPSIMAVLKSSLRFPAPTQIQAEAIPAAIRDKRDVIGAAQTGSGKTLGFGIPIIHCLLAEKDAARTRMNKEAEGEGEGKLRAVIMVPTRELALQVTEHMNAIAKPCGIWIAPIVGGISALKQERLLSKKPHIVVATPGRLWDMMRDAYVANHLTDFSALSFLVLDEADRMVQQGHYSELSSILGLIKVALNQRKEEEEEEEESEEEEENGDDEDDEDKGYADKKKKRKPKAVVKLQTFVFSATLTLPTNLRKRLRKGGGGASGSAGLENLMDAVPFTSLQSRNNNSNSNKPKIVDQTSERRLADKVTETIISCPEAEQDDYLYCFLASHPGRTIVFVNAISSVRRLAALLKLLSLPASPLHAGMQQRQRLTHLDNFKEDPNAILVATDVAARGLDVKDVRCVVHYQLPASVDTYVHRCGRTARADADGLTVAMVTPKENARHRALLRALGRGNDPPLEFPIDNMVMGAAKKRVRLAVRIDDVMRRKKKESAETSWRKRNAEEMGIMLSDEDGESDDDGRGEDDDDVVAVGKRRKTGKGNIRSIHDRKAVSEKQQEKEVGKLQLELAELLAEPLQPKISSKYFAGGATAAVAVGLEEKDKKKKNEKGGGKKDEREGGGGAAKVVKAAIAMANRKVVKDSGSSSSSKDKNDTAGGGGNVQAKGKKKKQGVQMSRKAALQAAIQKKLQGKQKNTKKGGLVVVPPAFGREMNGPDALQTLRNKLSLGGN